MSRYTNNDNLVNWLIHITGIVFITMILLFTALHVWLGVVNIRMYDLTSAQLQDQAIYYQWSRTILRGDPISSWYPVFSVVGAAFLGLMGINLESIEVGTQILHFVYAICIGLIIFNITKSRVSSGISGVLAYCFAVWQGYLEGFNPVFVMSMFTAIAVLVAIFAKGRIFLLLLSGVFLAFSFFSKQVMVLESFAVILFATLYGYKENNKSPLWVVLGGIIGVLLVIFWMSINGWLGVYIQNIQQGLQYTFEPSSTWHFNREFIPTFQRNFLGGSLPFLFSLIIFLPITISFIWYDKKYRVVAGITLAWLIFALIGAFVGRAMRRGYFVEVISPLIILNCLALPLYINTKKHIQLLLIVLYASLFFLNIWWVGFRYPSISSLQLASNKVEEEFTIPVHSLSQSLSEMVDKNECIWFWDGITLYLSFLADRDPCNDIPLSAYVMVRESFNIDRNRAQYIQELFDKRPTLHVFQPVWGYFPELQRFADRYRVEPPLLTQEETKLVSVYRVDMSPFRAQVADYGIFEMIGYDLYTPSQVCAGDSIELSLTWRNKTFNMRYYNTFVKLLTLDQTAQIAGIDSPPHPEQSTLDWTVKDMIYLSDRFRLDIPTETPSGEYVLVNGFYDNETGEPLLVSNAQQAGAPYVTLTTLEVIPCS